MLSQVHCLDTGQSCILDISSAPSSVRRRLGLPTYHSLRPCGDVAPRRLQADGILGDNGHDNNVS